jgi:hypothetical protein
VNQREDNPIVGESNLVGLMGQGKTTIFEEPTRRYHGRHPITGVWFGFAPHDEDNIHLRQT